MISIAGIRVSDVVTPKNVGCGQGALQKIRVPQQRERVILKHHGSAASGSGGTDFRNWSVFGREEARDRLYWIAVTDYLFAVRLSCGREFLYEGINPAFQSALGISSEDVGDIPVSACVNREDAKSVCKVFRACLAEGAEVRVRHRLALGGLRRNIETTVVPICDPDTGCIVRLLGSHRDVSKQSPESGGELDLHSHASVNERLISIQENIQQRIASDLHDSTCQHLVAASLNVMRIRAALSDGANAVRLCDDIDASIDQALREIRAFVYLLHPHDLMVDGLKVTIEKYADGFAARTLLKVSTKISREIDRLSYTKQRSLLRVVQEALTNVYRHAKATQVEIVIDAMGGYFELRIRDDGCGMVAGRAACSTRALSLGVGIPAMRARLRQIGGKLEIRSTTPGQERPGTTLCASVPRALAARRAQPARRRHSH
jgi:two-component system, NarL family, sensor kinase